ncbi:MULTISPECIES: 7-cyano-7-deazaguanine synthase QueC [Streptomyces]|uniref:7-cyano-7-deazaguanine synthase n=1 Tax=Streptomyces venezuelae (strain ATCC 10712 / CBS 650.69 / DSM 40230 / JCM 4526 / NBRC 13096 / PD 04745) TaxID=953739 RepID=F2R9F0_STRVP|nr:7-cyano-7-deazaguanine synthase QueC [Streptomyces venezuelae]APE24533.1 7-cyano-7-deazaguanine synthase QueC [Streptomyces venezuelae]QES01892.1 7-cyano-7-deazaguanine synthase QueC [Streptomyces venezuelae ATCC 10712]CCA58993.1 Queuosine Biosynthesis QueC ATPase [Streptomyces venezuelae ATCC 10712]
MPRTAAPRHAVLIFSGGLDSAVTAYKLLDAGVTVSLLSFNYGQRHVKELAQAATLADQLGVSHDIVDLTSLNRILGGSALTDPAIEVPHGHYRAETMRSTVVPNRNAIMLEIAAGAAVAAGADAVAFGAHSGDHAIYPDCRPEFFTLIEAAMKAGNEGHIVADFQLVAPFLQLTKADIVREGARLDVPFKLTWSCYEGGELHCGACGTCVERREAFDEAGVADPTLYAAAPKGAAR